MAETEEKKGTDAVQKKQLPVGGWVAIALACALVGGLVGHFAFGGTGAALGTTTLAEDKLDTVVATYTYGGATNQVSARDVITYQSSLSSALNDDGTYNVPGADSALAVARNKIIEKEAENRGISMSDEQVTSYAEENLGQSDFSAIASSYGLEEDAVKDLIRQSALMSELRNQVVTASSATLPSAPQTAEEGQEATPTADYAQYITSLAGDEWDASANDGRGGWKSSDGTYATALADYEVTNDSATYEAAQAAYYVAYQQYSTEQSAVTQQWTDFVNGLFCNATIQLNNMIA